MIRVVVADALHIVTYGVRALLERENEFSVVGESNDGFDAMSLVEKMCPDALIVDAMMPSLNGIEVARRVKQQHLKTRILILTMHDNDACVIEALRNGVSGYVLKDEAVPNLTQALRCVMSGHYYLSPPLLKRAIDAYIENIPEHDNAYGSLTMREREILQLAAEGGSIAEIAAKLSISIRTVETHRSRMMSKLDIHNQTELVRYAMKIGILQMQQTHFTE